MTSRLLAAGPENPSSSRGELAIDGERRAGEGRRSQRREIEPLEASANAAAVALKFLAVSQPVMHDHHRLGSLQMRVAGNDHVDVAVAAGDEGPLQVFEQGVDPRGRVPHEELEVGRYLVIAAAGRMQLAAHVAECGRSAPLDVHVDVFELGAERKGSRLDLGADLVQRGEDLSGIRRS